MEQKSALLNTLIQPRISRKSVDVLEDKLPPKTEFILKLQLTTTQREKYLDHLRKIGFKDGIRGRPSGQDPQVIIDAHTFSRICTHPSFDEEDFPSSPAGPDSDDDFSILEPSPQPQLDNRRTISCTLRYQLYIVLFQFLHANFRVNISLAEE
jgi:SNF2 family DNA or RNA helicase